MALTGALLTVVLFAVLLHAFGVVQLTRDAVTISRRAAALVRDPSVADDEKERQMQRDSLALFRLLALLLAGTAAALVLPAAGVLGAEALGIVAADDVFAYFLRWDFLIAATVLGTVAYLAAVRWLKRSS